MTSADFEVVPEGASIVFWLNSPSPHMAPLIRQLAGHFGFDVTVIAEWGMTRERKVLGWQEPDHGGARVFVGVGDDERRELERELVDADFHVFSGISAYPATTASMRRLATSGARHIAVITEPSNPTGLRGCLRVFRHRIRVLTNRSRIDTFFGIGRLARLQLLASSADAEKVFPFAYVVDERESEPTMARGAEPFTVGFVGNLTERKNPKMLLRALARLPAGDWHLVVAGSGALEPSVQSLAEALDISARVEFLGALPNREIRKLVSKLDVLVLPSRFDGWGAVVNEALHAGVPVLVSAMVGAAELVQSDLQGAVFRAGSVDGLARELERILRAGKRSSDSRTQLRASADDAIGAESVAKYFAAVLSRQDGERPRTPWLNVRA